MHGAILSSRGLCDASPSSFFEQESPQGTKIVKNPLAKISAAGRARIAAAQRARWAKVKGTSGNSTIPKKRTMSVAARKRIAAAPSARWAKVKGVRKRHS